MVLGRGVLWFIWDLPWVWQHSKGVGSERAMIIDQMRERIFPIRNVDSTFILKKKGKQ